MPTVHVLIGLPGSGKSTFADQFRPLPMAAVVSSDQIRQDLLGDVNDQTRNDRVFLEYYKLAKDALKEGKDVILDATNISIKSRKRIFEELKRHNPLFVAHYFATHITECLNRNSLRERYVPVSVIERMYKSLQVPVYCEGWNDIEVHYYSKSKGRDPFGMYDDVSEWNDFISNPQSYSSIMGGNTILHGNIFRHIYELPQDSKHHSLSVSRHTYYVWKHILENYKENDKLAMLWAGLLHDTGKAYCKEFKILENGEESRYANFIGHENVSAQLAIEQLYGKYDTDFILDVVEIVLFHMRLMQLEKNSKADIKFKEFVGDDLYEKLEFFRDADTSAK